jgi:hypothetical protein
MDTDCDDDSDSEGLEKSRRPVRGLSPFPCLIEDEWYPVVHEQAYHHECAIRRP